MIEHNEGLICLGLKFRRGLACQRKVSAMQRSSIANENGGMNMGTDKGQPWTEKDVSRRKLLQALGISGGVAAMSFAGIFGQDVVNAAPAGDDAQTIINYAATAEALAVTEFYAIITASSFFGGLPPLYQNYLRSALTQEQLHYDYLVAAGAQPLANQFFFPDTILENLGLYVAVVDILESAFIGAYLAGIRRFGELGAPELSEFSAQILGVEAGHRVLNRAMGIEQGLFSGLASQIPLERPTLEHVSQAGPLLAPTLSGGMATSGPAEGINFGVGPVAMPSADQVKQVGAEQEAVPPALIAYGVPIASLIK